MAAGELSDEQRRLKAELLEKWEAADQRHKQHATRFDHFFSLWHGHKDLVRSHAGASPRDRDGILNDARNTWGSDLHIPYAFATVETVMPRVVSNRPRMLVLPRSRVSERNVENMRFTIDAQQDKCRYERKLQQIARHGLTVGLGVGKTLWRHEERRQMGVAKAGWVQRAQGNDWVERPWTEVLWDDPDAQVVSPYDFRWSPLAIDVETMEYAFHRTWRSTRYCLTKIEQGRWNLLPGLDAEQLRQSGGLSKYNESQAGRMEASGVRSQDIRSADVHEVWEFHDGGRVVTLLNREWPVQEAKAIGPAGELPFHVYRPTEVPDQLVGKGEIEPIEDLQQEMNELRRDRRDNARLKLEQTYAYSDGAIDADDFRVGPGFLIPVKGNFDPREVLHPLQVGDIPNSGYQEEAALRNDIQLTSGVSDVVSGGGGSSGAAETATGAQLVLAGATARIQLKTRLLEIDVIAPQTRWFGFLNQQRILKARDVRIPYQPKPGEDPDRRWAWRRVSPEELAGEFEYQSEGGATAPVNVPQDRQDANLLLAVMGSPFGQALDQRAMLEMVLEKVGVRNPGLMLGPEKPMVPPEVLPILEKLMVEEYHQDPQLAQGIIGQALNMATEATQQGGGPAAGQAAQPPGENGQPADPQAAARAAGVGPE